MAGKVYCVACAQLPAKDRSLAVKTVQCPDCQLEFGVTSYGAPFRIQAAKRMSLLSTAVVTGLTIGVGVFVFASVLIALGIWSRDALTPKTPADPAPPNVLARVPEVAVDKPFPAKVDPNTAKRHLNELIARIRNVNNNGKDRDAFVLARMEERPELKGLPFIMGDACRMGKERAQSFQNSVQAVRDGLEVESHVRTSTPHNEHAQFWNTYFAGTAQQGVATDHGVAALTQILGPERKTLRSALVSKLSNSSRPEATRALARSAVFDVDDDVRIAAAKLLEKRRAKDDNVIVAEVLMHGIRYPMAKVAKQAVSAAVMLSHKDLNDLIVPQLVAFLDEPAPGDPEDAKVDDKPACVVREVVRINHHRNCLLCHPPSSTGQPSEVPGVMPIPGNPFPSSPREAYGRAQSSGEPMVRADTTYLRQDFSVMMPVADAAPWPDMQRFDFLVRTRVVEGKELANLQHAVAERPADFVSVNHRGAVHVLEQMTGQKAAPNAAAWQRVLGGNAE